MRVLFTMSVIILLVVFMVQGPAPGQVPVFVDGPPQVLLPALSPYEQLIEIPRVALPATPAPQPSKYLMFIPAALLLALVVFLQRRRRTPRKGKGPNPPPRTRQPG